MRIILLMVVAIGVFTSCKIGNNSVSGNIKEMNSQIYLRLPEIYEFNNFEKIFGADDHGLIVKRFAESFKPLDGSLAVLPLLDKKMVYHFWQLKQSNYSEFELYIAMMVVKVYRKHIEKTHQGYDMRRDPSGRGGVNPMDDYILYEYCVTSENCNPDSKGLFVSDSTWVEKNKRFLENPIIKSEYQIIKKTQRNIEKGVYWKE